MKVKFYGVRGSYPTPGQGTVRYGGNTTCVTIYKEIDGKICRLIFDCGTGIIQLGRDVIANYFEGKEDINIRLFFTHLHPDHTQGFPFFAPNYFRDCNFYLYGMESLRKDVGELMALTMLPPTFPIEYKDLKSRRIHKTIRDGDVIKAFIINGAGEKVCVFEIETLQVFAPTHPQQGCLYYRVTDTETGKSVVCVWDNESPYCGDKRVIRFAKDANVMIHDAMYTLREYEDNTMIVHGFGHSTPKLAFENAIQAGITDALILTHFNPAHDDTMLDEIGEDVKQYHETHFNDREFTFTPFMAKEGWEIEV